MYRPVDSDPPSSDPEPQDGDPGGCPCTCACPCNCGPGNSASNHGAVLGGSSPTTYGNVLATVPH